MKTKVRLMWLLYAVALVVTGTNLLRVHQEREPSGRWYRVGQYSMADWRDGHIYFVMVVDPSVRACYTLPQGTWAINAPIHAPIAQPGHSWLTEAETNAKVAALNANPTARPWQSYDELRDDARRWCETYRRLRLASLPSISIKQK